MATTQDTVYAGIRAANDPEGRLTLQCGLSREDRGARMTDRKADASLILSPEELAEISRHAVPRQFRARTVLVSEGEDTDALYIIVEGRARAFVGDENGREIVLSVMGPGEYFGDIAFDDGPRSASVITLEPCKMLVVPHEEFEEFVKSNPTFAMNFVRKLIHQVRSLTQNVRSLALMDAYGRVARLLMDSAVTQDGEQFIPEKLTQTEIANRVGCSREMVSRIFKDLVQGHYITIEPTRIVINRKPPAKW